MLHDSEAFSGFSVNDMEAAKGFYRDTLGLPVNEEGPGLGLQLTGGTTVFIYPKDDHEPASFTVLNFPVDDIDAAVDWLIERGVELERYDGFDQDERGIAEPPHGPRIAWLTDPAGNVLSVIQA